MGRKLILTGTTIDNPAAPRLAAVDQIESAGSLFLMEPANPAGAWAPGIPSASSMIPNLFGSTLTGLGGVGETRASVVYGSAINDGTKGKIERSAKGGLHGIVSQAVDLAVGDGLGFKMPAALYSYFVANPNHIYYVSIWDRLTRVNGGMPSAYVMSYNTGGSNFNFGIASTGQQGWWGPSSNLTDNVNKISNLTNAAGPRFANVEATTFDSGGTSYHFIGPNWGAPNGGAVTSATLASRNRFFPSILFYRYYIEDLTVSGRTYAQVNSLDRALYAKEITTAGGRYYGDTFTDPATIP